MLFDQEKENQRLAAKIHELNQKDYLPKDLVELLNAAYSLQVEARAAARVVLPGLEQLAPTEYQSQGAPLIPRPDLPFDQAQATKLFGAFIELLRGRDGALAEAAELVAARIASDPGELVAAFQAYRNVDDAYFNAWAERTQQAPKTMAFLVQASMAPSLAAAADQLAASLPAESIWEHGHCPVCGSLPLIAALREKEGFRYLSCSYCSTEYRAARLGCPLCGEKDYQKLSFFFSPDAPGFKVHVCASCSMYVKTVDFREFDKTALPLFDDLESLPLDILAQSRGFKRPTTSGWGF
jgi:FdhE protein